MFSPRFGSACRRRWLGVVSLCISGACTVMSDEFEPQPLAAAAGRAPPDAGDVPGGFIAPLDTALANDGGDAAAECNEPASVCGADGGCAARSACTDAGCAALACGGEGLRGYDVVLDDVPGVVPPTGGLPVAEPPSSEPPIEAAEGEACFAAPDCASGVCADAGCAAGTVTCCQAPRCDDDVVNGTEPVTDCGNAPCGPCPLDSVCTEDGQCDSGRCAGGLCSPPPCEDAALGPGETDVDCGGACDACEPGRACSVDADCSSGVCETGRCCGGAASDCTRCARRLAGSNGCSSLASAADQQSCDAFLQCLADNVATCPTRLALGCSNEPDAVCNHLAFGGNGSAALTQADSVIGTAGCRF